jgi:YspA, cpYpsA-related SLOG family
MFKVVVAGSRDFNDYKLLRQKLINLLRNKKPSEVEIVSGKAQGADSLGERFAKEKGCKLKEFPADWNKWRGIAGHVRNAEMAQYADACVVFWDGKSEGSKNMIEQAEREGLQLKIVRYSS